MSVATTFPTSEGVTHAFAPPTLKTAVWSSVPPAPPPPVAQAIRANRLVLAEDRVLVWVIEQDKTAGGLFIPDVAKNNARDYTAWIIAVGPDAAAQGWAPGQKVRTSQFAGVKMSMPRKAGESADALPIDMMVTRDLLCLDFYEEA